MPGCAAEEGPSRIELAPGSSERNQQEEELHALRKRVIRESAAFRRYNCRAGLSDTIVRQISYQECARPISNLLHFRLGEAAITTGAAAINTAEKQNKKKKVQRPENRGQPSKEEVQDSYLKRRGVDTVDSAAFTRIPMEIIVAALGILRVGFVILFAVGQRPVV